MLYGAGKLVFSTNDLDTNGSARAQNLAYPGLFSAFELNSESGFLEAKALVEGRLATVASAINEENWTMSITTQFLDWTAMQFALDELATTVTDPVIQVLKTAVVPATTFLVTDSDITAATEAGVKAYLAEKGPWGERKFLKAVSGAPADGTEFQVDGTAGTILFDASLVGATVQYVVGKAYSSIEAIGADAASDRFGQLNFVGELAGTEFGKNAQILVPRLSRTSVPSISIAGDITELTMEFKALVPAGKKLPFTIYNLDTALA